MKNLSAHNFTETDEEYIFLPGHRYANQSGYVKTAKLKILNNLLELMDSELQIKKTKQTKLVVPKIKYMEASK